MASLEANKSPRGGSDHKRLWELFLETGQNLRPPIEGSIRVEESFPGCPWTSDGIIYRYNDDQVACIEIETDFWNIGKIALYAVWNKRRGRIAELVEVISTKGYMRPKKLTEFLTDFVEMSEETGKFNVRLLVPDKGELYELGTDEWKNQFGDG